MNGNTITVVGNLTKDPTMKYTTTGKAVTDFTVACNHGWRDRDSQTWVEGEASFFKVECWETMAENVVESIRKGDPVIVIGRLNRRTYEQDGVTRESWEIRADNVGADMRKRAASLRRVQRQNQKPVDGAPAQSEPATQETENPDDLVEGQQPVYPTSPAPEVAGLAVAS